MSSEQAGGTTGVQAGAGLVLPEEVSSRYLLQPDHVRKLTVGANHSDRGASVGFAVIGSSLAIVGAAVAVLTAAGLYASGWDFRPQDRPEGHWQFIVQLGTAGLVIAASSVVLAALVVILAGLRRLPDGPLTPLVGPVVFVVGAGAVEVLAVLIGVPAIQHAEFLSPDPPSGFG